MEYFIPKDTSKLFKSNGLQSKDIDNFSLRLNRYVRADLFSLKNEYEGVSFDTNIDTDRVDRYYNTLELMPYKQSSLFVKNDWKLTLGMGSGSVYNTSMTLHHIYGVPYLPAQSIKGAFRSYIVQRYFTDELFSEQYNKYSDFEEEVLYKTSWFVELFGSNNQQGKVIFFDAFSKDFKIVKDIMTPHYKDYYGDTKNGVAPTDTQNPMPINFLALQDASFKICFAFKENTEIKDGIFKGKKILELIEEELSTSLEIFGIGGKTSVGYGYFTAESEPKSPMDREWDIAKETINPIVLKSFIEKFPNSKFSDLANDKLIVLLNSIENQKREEEDNKLKKAEGFSLLETCTDLNDGLKIINNSLGKNPKFSSEQLELLKLFYAKNKNKKKYAKGIYKKYEKWM